MDKPTKENGYFIGYHDIFRSSAFADLSPIASKLLMMMLPMHNGYNNGSIELSARQASWMLKTGINQAQAALRDLQNKGFLVLTYKGRRINETIKKKSEWEITLFDGYDSKGSKRPATHDYMKWTPDIEAVPVDDIQLLDSIGRKKQARKSRAKQPSNISEISIAPSIQDIEKQDNDKFMREYEDSLYRRNDIEELEEIPF